jgi:hypothetical protein
VQRLGYVLANEDNEFLVAYHGNEAVRRLVWSRLPDLAKRFASRDAALPILAREHSTGRPLYLCELYDDADWFVVQFPDSGSEQPPT